MVNSSTSEGPPSLAIIIDGSNWLQLKGHPFFRAGKKSASADGPPPPEPAPLPDLRPQKTRKARAALSGSEGRLRRIGPGRWGLR